jgi:hypothetical protein
MFLHVQDLAFVLCLSAPAFFSTSPVSTGVVSTGSDSLSLSEISEIFESYCLKFLLGSDLVWGGKNKNKKHICFGILGLLIYFGF